MEKWKRIILLIGVFILVINSVNALVFNKTEFDDGSGAFNITANTTKFLTLPINSSISQANIDIKGLKGELVTDNEIGYNCSGDSISNCANAFDEDWSTGLTINSGSTNNIFLENYSLVTGSSYANYIYYGDALRVVCAGTCSYTYLKANCYNGSNFIPFGTSVFSSAQDNISSTIPAACLVNPVQIKLNHSVSINSDKTLYESKIEWGNSTYAQNVKIYTNNTLVFNHTGNLTDTNSSINLNLNSALQNCYINNTICDFVFSTDTWGKLEVFDFFIEYNTTNSAFLSINSPVQISKSITSGSSFTSAVNVSNTGDWNATNLTFITVSSSTPNLNDSITHDCGGITLINGSNIVCNVTFSSITIEPEPDEKLRVRAIGTDNNGTVFSDSIDVDVSLTAASTGGGGGGGGRPTSCEWKVWRPANRVIKSFGWFGYKTNPISYQIFNNESQAIEFNYRTTGLNCELTQNKQVIEGNSFGLNQIQCEYPESVDTGIIIIDGGGCSQSIDVQLVSNTFGLLTTYLTGGAGVLVALVIWFSIFMVIIFITKVI